MWRNFAADADLFFLISASRQQLAAVEKTRTMILPLANPSPVGREMSFAHRMGEGGGAG